MRQSKTPRQRAEEQLAVAERAVTRWAEKRDRAQTEYENAEAEHAAAVRRRDYLAAHPDLGDAAKPLRVRTGVDLLKPPTTPTSTGDTPQ